jgi:hypothetical protein
MEILLKTECRSGSCKIIDRMYTNKELHLNQFKVFGETNRIISSPHRTNNKELEIQKNEVNWITSRFICVGYYPLVAISK